MANLVRLGPERVEFPHHGFSYSIAPPLPVLQDGLAAYQHLKEELSLQTLSLAKRREATAFLRRFGGLLLEAAFPENSLELLDPREPLLLELHPEMQPYPWELLHDGEGWLALERGVVRFVAPPTPPEPAPLAARPFKVLAVSANPLPGAEERGLAEQRERLGPRFISSVGALLEPPERPEPEFEVRTLEHASRDVLEDGLSRSPHLLYYTGFSQRDGWLMESEGLEPELAGREWLAARMGRAGRAGLRGLVVNDSLSLLAPEAAARQAEGFFRAGLPAMIRICGRQARTREQDYLRTLVRALASGSPIAAAHLAAIRRLARRFEESWDWSFVCFYQRALPENGGGAIRYELPGPVTTRASFSPPCEAGEAGAHEGPFALMPPPPRFRGRRRFFGREAELKQLAGWLRPGAESASPLVFLSGEAGSGKTALALEAARRAHRCFTQVAYLHGRDLPPPLPALAASGGLGAAEPSPLQALLEATIRHLQLTEVAALPHDQQEEALNAALAAGAPRLIIMDGLENHPGYYRFCKALERFPPTCRVLIISRAKPPLLAGAHLDLTPVGAMELAAIFHPSLVERIAAFPHSELLLRVCGRDLQFARMLWRLPRWPAAERMAPLLAQTARNAGRAGAGDLLELVLQAALAELSRDAASVLQALSMFTYLVHQEVLSHLTELDGRRLGQALAELRWLGLADAFAGERYAALQPRLQGSVARRMVTPAAYARLRPALARTYHSYLATTQKRIGAGHGREAAPGYSLLAWGEAGTTPHNLELTHAYHRLGLERINLAELAVMLAEEENWRSLARFAAAAAFLQDVPGMENLMVLVNRLLLAAGRVEQDSATQATALLGLARPLLAKNRPAEAQPLLEKALDLLTAQPGWEELAQTYLLLSRCYDALQRPEAALNMLQAAEELARQLGNPERLAEAAEEMVRHWERRNDNSGQSERFLEQTIRQLEQEGHAVVAARLRLLLGEQRAAAGQTQQARAMFEAALRAFQNSADTGEESGIHGAMLRLAELQLAEELPDEALDTFMQAQSAAGGTATGGLPAPGFPNAVLADRVLLRSCEMFERQQRYQEALNGYLLLRKMREAQGDREGLLKVLDVIGGLYFQLGEQANSIRFYEESLQLKETIPHA